MVQPIRSLCLSVKTVVDFVNLVLRLDVQSEEAGLVLLQHFLLWAGEAAG